MTEIKYDEVDVNALKALAEGKASAGQQRRALNFFLNVSGVRDMPRVTENSLEMAFNEGRRYPGWHVAKLIELVGITAPSQPKGE